MRHLQVWTGVAVMVLMLVCFPATAQDAAGCKDHPLFTRITDFEIDDCEIKDFDSHEFTDRNEKDIVFEGKITFIGYCLKKGGKERAFLEIWKNYVNAITKIGGTVEYSNRYSGNLHLNKDGKEVWVQVNDSGGSCYSLYIVEKKAMVQEITANEMLDTLNKQGFIALYINFDTNKATIKPESQSIVDQIAKMLKDNPKLNVSIEGHTDSVGTPANNKTLSKQRADAVVAALVKQGIDAKRLSAIGWGQDKPIADNRSEEGKAKNRRVEIVKK
ncbi:MAG: OmpA family protein [Desulfobacteraceae bacterium]|nr:MAG: OmpA family protein [Desulfobacteraceae bacterium]